MFHVCSRTWFFPAAVWGEAGGIAELFEIYCGPKGVPAFSNLLD
jgi:hypothetical protein